MSESDYAGKIVNPQTLDGGVCWGTGGEKAWDVLDKDDYASVLQDGIGDAPIPLHVVEAVVVGIGQGEVDEWG